MKNEQRAKGAPSIGLLEPSPYGFDGGTLIGRDPRRLTPADFDAAGVRLLPVMKAVRENCIQCSGGQVGEVRKCVQFRCPIWPMRMGIYPSGLRAAASAHGLASAEENEA